MTEEYDVPVLVKMVEPAPAKPQPVPPPPPPARSPETDSEWHARVNARAAMILARSGYLKREQPWMDVWKRSPWSFM
jgi:hypothetical protein